MSPIPMTSQLSMTYPTIGAHADPHLLGHPRRQSRIGAANGDGGGLLLRRGRSGKLGTRARAAWSRYATARGTNVRDPGEPRLRSRHRGLLDAVRLSQFSWLHDAY